MVSDRKIREIRRRAEILQIKTDRRDRVLSALAAALAVVLLVSAAVQ
jgi:truncated hemoglobin YjbI